MNNYVLLGVLAVMMIIMLVLPSVTQKKRIKEFNDMVDNLRVGDEIRTIGGIIGRIVKINNRDYGKTIVVETGDKGTKSTMEFDVAAVGLVLKSTAKKQEKKVEETVAVETPTVEGEDATSEKPVDNTKVSEDIVKADKKASKRKKK